MEDEKIIELYWQRSPQAIDETSRKYGAYCMRLSMNILMNREDSEENVNDTYLRVWNAIPPQRPQFFAAFLGRIACHPAASRRMRPKPLRFPTFSANFCAPKARRPAGCSCSDISCVAQSRRSPTTLDFPKAVSNPCCCVPAPVWQNILKARDGPNEA